MIIWVIHLFVCVSPCVPLLCFPALELAADQERQGECEEGQQGGYDDDLPQWLLMALRGHLAVEARVVVDAYAARHATFAGIQITSHLL